MKPPPHTEPLTPPPSPSDRHMPTLSYADFGGLAHWFCSCGASGEGTGSPSVGWADHVAAIIRDDRTDDT